MSIPTQQFYGSLVDWLSERLSKEDPGFLVGVNGPQGCGKTTITTALCELLAKKGKRAITISIDDFYLTRPEQIRLAAEFPQNPYLQQRGYPGTHDIELGARVMRSLKSGDMSVNIPRYEKSLHGGQGDRLPESEWSQVDGVVDIVFLEGWMLGFTPVPEKIISSDSLRETNRMLEPYKAWHRAFDGFLQLAPEDYHFVVEWRTEAEQKMRASGKPGMSDLEIRAYIEKFLPAYALYLPQLEKKPATKKKFPENRDR